LQPDRAVRPSSVPLLGCAVPNPVCTLVASTKVIEMDPVKILIIAYYVIKIILELLGSPPDDEGPGIPRC
jgi:hypothetical protein